MSEEKKSTKCLFDQFLDAKDDVIEALKKPLMKRKAKGLFKSALRNAENDKVDAIILRDKLRSNVNSPDIPSVVAEGRKIRKADELIEDLKIEYKVQFNKELKSEED